MFYYIVKFWPMKILWSFNTKLDEHELYDAIQKNGQWNAIMMKKHRVFLVRPMIWMLFAFIAFWLLIWFAYRQFFSDYSVIFRVMSIAYGAVTFSRCIHSLLMIIYDIQIQTKSKERYIDTIEEADFKDGKYESFLRHSFISMASQIVLMVVNFVISFAMWDNSGNEIAINIIWIFVNIWFIFLLYKVLDRIIDYEMDFNIFTVDQFILYRQHWFFKTESMNIATSTIKIVNESKSWFRWALLHYWKVSIHPEWNLWSSSKAIELHFVPEPKHLTKKLNEFIEKSKEMMNVAVAS